MNYFHKIPKIINRAGVRKFSGSEITTFLTNTSPILVNITLVGSGCYFIYNEIKGIEIKLNTNFKEFNITEKVSKKEMEERMEKRLDRFEDRLESRLNRFEDKFNIKLK